MAFIRNMFGGDSVDDRLEELNEIDNFDSWIEAQEEVDAEVAASSTMDEARTLLEPLNNVLANRKWGQSMRGKLERANVKLTVAEYFASHFVAAGTLFALLFIWRGSIIAATIGGLVGFFVPRFYVNRQVNQRLHAFEGQLADTLGLWVNALRSGFSVMQAMEAISKDAPEPTMTEFRRIVKEVQLGIDMEDALDHLLNRIQSEDLDFVVTAVNIQREVGGNLAEILEVVSHTIRERIKLKGEIRVLTSQGRYTGYLISFMPIGLAFLLNILTPGYMGQMIENRKCGWPMLGVGLALIGMGTAIIQKIVDIEI
ncbi:MAG: type II secretion system F family protein [Anaerolineae bacterium]|nr:type II secretion system F family protein [Anaerolineae bacterium]